MQFLTFETTILINDIRINITRNIYPFVDFSVIAACVVLIIILFGLVVKNWELIKFWMFLKFGIQFKDKIEMVENVADIDYDAFINYKCVILLS